MSPVRFYHLFSLRMIFNIVGFLFKENDSLLPWQV